MLVRGWTGVTVENSTVRQALTYQFTNTEYPGSKKPSRTGICFLAPSSRGWQGPFELERHYHPLVLKLPTRSQYV